MFKKTKAKLAASRLQEEKLYEAVFLEQASGVRREGLYNKALAFSDGNVEKANSLYIQYRVQSIKDENCISEFIAENSTKNMENSSEMYDDEFESESSYDVYNCDEEKIIKDASSIIKSMGFPLFFKNGKWTVIDKTNIHHTFLCPSALKDFAEGCKEQSE